MNTLSIRNDLQLNIVKATIIYASNFKYLIQGCEFMNDVRLSIPWALVSEKKLNAAGGMACAK